MFKKKPTIKSLTQIRSSDRRKLADQIIADFDLQQHLQARIDQATTAAAKSKADAVPDFEADKADDNADPADALRSAALIGLRNSLVPENTQAAKFSTTAGPDLKPLSGTIYVGPADETGPPRALWIRLYDKMYPTVYTLWKHPKIVPLLHTPQVVVAKIQAGASLMTPGLADEPPFPARATKGAIVAVASWENPTVPVAVGTCVIDVSALTDVHGARGHAVEPVHWAGDELAIWTPSGSKAGPNPPEEIAGWGDQVENVDEDSVTDKAAITEAADQPVPIVSTEVEQHEPLADGVANLEIQDQDDTATPSQSWSQKDVDTAFHDAFIYGLLHYAKTHPTHRSHGLDYPLSQSFVISSLVQPFLPVLGSADAAAAADTFSIKRTSWKTAKKFVRQLAKEKLIKSKDQGNESVIMDIDFKHDSVVHFAPLHRAPKQRSGNGQGQATSGSVKADASGVAKSGQGQGSAGADTTTAGPANNPDPSRPDLKMSTFYRPKPFLSPIFPTDSRTFLTKVDIQTRLNDYVTAEKLVDLSNKRMITLDPVLAGLFSDADRPRSGSVTRASVYERILTPAGSSPFWLLHPSSVSAPVSSSAATTTAVGQSSDMATPTTTVYKPKPGHPPKLSVSLENRMGNKTVTKLTGLEQFGVDAHSLADELRRACAASTSVDRASGVKKGIEAWEVMVQGKRTKDVLAVLERGFGVKEEWVDVVDKSKKK